METDNKLINRKTLIYIIIFGIFMVLRYVFVYDIESINPFVTRQEDNRLWIYSKQYQIYLLIPFVLFLMMFFSFLIKKTVHAMIVLCNVFNFLLCYYGLGCLIEVENMWLELLYYIFMFVYINVVKKHFRNWYPQIKFNEYLAKYKNYKIIAFFTLLSILNIIYICVPKKYIYIYDRCSKTIEYEVDEEIIIERVGIEIESDTTNQNYNGWLFEAKYAGQTTISIRDFHNDWMVGTQKININNNLRFENVLTWEYICLFYPLNVAIIVLCCICIVRYIFFIGIKGKIES